MKFSSVLLQMQYTGRGSLGWIKPVSSATNTAEWSLFSCSPWGLAVFASDWSLSWIAWLFDVFFLFSAILDFPFYWLFPSFFFVFACPVLLCYWSLSTCKSNRKFSLIIWEIGEYRGTYIVIGRLGLMISLILIHDMIWGS